MNKMKVLVIYNYSHKKETLEKDYSEESVKECALSVKNALESAGCQVQIRALLDNSESLKSLIDFISNGNVDIVFNLCEGFGWDSSMEHNIAGIFELLNIKFTGSGSVSLATCLNKGRTKEILSYHGIKTPNFQSIYSNSRKIKESLRIPLIIKPLMEDASIGIKNDSVVYDISMLGNRVSSFLKKYKKPALVEEYIDGREFNVAVMGNSCLEVLPISEIDFSGLPEGINRICTYEGKWDINSLEYQKTPPVCPANVDSELENIIKKTAVEAYKIMECKDYARIDMRLSIDGILYVLEVNPNPDLSTNAGFANIARASEMSYNELISEILRLALGRYNN